MKLPVRFKATGGSAKGGMSHAQVCRDSNLDREVVVKRLQDHTDERRLIDEIKALARIRSKHVVQIYDVIRSDSGKVVGLVEEYLPGDDLSSLAPITDSSLLLRTAYAIACGLADIHSEGVIHRDIKPVNMKFDAEMCLKIFDFGLARAEGSDAATEGAVGTNGFMAPELCPVGWDEEVRFSPAVDTYAFGATLLWLIAGAVPGEMKRRQPSVPASADFRNQPVPIPPDVAATLNACLVPNAGARPPMAAVRDLLGAHLLRDRHRATLVVRDERHELHATRRSVLVTLDGLGSFKIGYSGLAFSITEATNNVYVNNMVVTAPQVLPGSCVVTVGTPDLGMNRVHVTVDVSHPEVVL